MKAGKAAAIFAALAVVMTVMAAVPVSAGTTERQYAELGKTYTIQGGHGSGYMIFQKYVLANASDNLSVNWKTGVQGTFSNYWELDINVYIPALNWSSNLTENGVHYQMYSYQGTPPLSLWVRPSVNTMVYIAFITFGNFADQTLNITVKGTPTTGGGDLQKQINDLKAQLNALAGTVTLLNSTVNTMEKQITNLSKNLTVLESTVGNNTKAIKDLQVQLGTLQALYNALAKNMTKVQAFIAGFNVTGDNVTVIYQNITKLYNNITNLTKFTTENVTKTIMMYQNTTKTINAYDNKTLAVLRANLTKASAEVADLAKDLNSTAPKSAVSALDGKVDSLKNTTAKSKDVKQIKADQSSVIGSLILVTVILIAAFGTLHTQNRRKIKEHDAYIVALVEPMRPPSKPDIKKASAKRVSQEKDLEWDDRIVGPLELQEEHEKRGR